mmetsp:Transcript_13285/g.33165  ORF Transcript_13285/g.33165 Transcript_13285/m.33165 type:complete len:219 (+) Transcript_13285:487-1143(+)
MQESEPSLSTKASEKGMEMPEMNKTPQPTITPRKRSLEELASPAMQTSIPPTGYTTQDIMVATKSSPPVDIAQRSSTIAYVNTIFWSNREMIINPSATVHPRPESSLADAKATKPPRNWIMPATIRSIHFVPYCQSAAWPETSVPVARPKSSVPVAKSSRAKARTASWRPTRASAMKRNTGALTRASSEPSVSKDADTLLATISDTGRVLGGGGDGGR